MVKVAEVFTPSSNPTITYVERTAKRFEQHLQNAVEIRNMVISISGPSKSGKSVLVRKVVHKDSQIPVSGSTIKSSDDLWKVVLSWMEAPTTTVATKTTGKEISGTASLKGEAGIPFITKAEASGTVGAKGTDTTATAETRTTGGLGGVIKEIAGTDFAVLIDDFHYIDRTLQEDIAKQIKAAAEGGVRIITASVPHRADDVVRANPELRGRVSAIDITYWSVDELRRIARLGFDALNVDLSPDVELQLAEAAFGSPQLMQTLCLCLCFEAGIAETWKDQKRLEVDGDLLRRVFSRSTSFFDFTTLVEALHSGPKVRGSDRNRYPLVDGTQGDAYRATLLAMSSDPPQLSINYDEILKRVKSVCQDSSPPGSSVSEALRQMEQISAQLSPTQVVLEWDDDVLAIAEPYFLFFLRFSDKLEALGK